MEGLPNDRPAEALVTKKALESSQSRGHTFS